MQDKIIQPSLEFEQEYKDKLINVSPQAINSSENTKVLMPDELYPIDK